MVPRPVRLALSALSVLVVAFAAMQLASDEPESVLRPGTPVRSVPLIDVASSRFRGELVSTIDPEDPAVGMYAEDFGLSREQALRNLELQGILERLQGSLVADFRARSVAIELTNDELGTVRIHAPDVATAHEVVDRYIERGGAPARFEYVHSG